MTARYNVAYTIAFSADQVDRENPTKSELLAGLRRRLAEVEDYPEDELIGAIWPPFDSFDRDDQRRDIEPQAVNIALARANAIDLRTHDDRDVLQVLVPKAGTAASDRIRRGSGIVCVAGVTPTVSVDFEGNVYNAENLRDYAQRVQHAADRLRTHYPTTARAVFPRHDFIVVGTVRVDVDNALIITDDARVREWCDR